MRLEGSTLKLPTTTTLQGALSLESALPGVTPHFGGPWVCPQEEVLRVQDSGQRLQLPEQAFWTWGQLPFLQPHLAWLLVCPHMRVPGLPLGCWGTVGLGGGGHCWPMQRGDSA